MKLSIKSVYKEGTVGYNEWRTSVIQVMNVFLKIMEYIYEKERNRVVVIDVAESGQKILLVTIIVGGNRRYKLFVDDELMVEIHKGKAETEVVYAANDLLDSRGRNKAWLTAFYWIGIENIQEVFEFFMM